MRKHNLIRLYCDTPIQQNVLISLPAHQAHYLSSVMRKDVADSILIFNGKDGQWRAEISSLGKKSCDIIPLEQTRQQYYVPDIWLCFAPVKNSKIEFIAQKATELGVSALQPMITQHTIVDKVKREKILANVIEAAEQCERLCIPEVFESQKLIKLLGNWQKDRHIILCDESGYGTPAIESLKTLDGIKKLAVFIGPEGGFSKEELEILHKLPYVTSIGLGSRILRADTASVAALSCVQALLGDWHRMPEFRN